MALCHKMGHSYYFNANGCPDCNQARVEQVRENREKDMVCDSGAHGSPEMADGAWMAEYNKTADNHDNNPLNFALFGLARQDVFPEWVDVDYSKKVLDLGPGKKKVHRAIRCDYPRYNFESPQFNPKARTTNNVSHIGIEREVGEFGYTDDFSKFRCTLPFPTGSVGGVFAVNVLEHLWDPRPIMEEVARVLAPGAPFNIVVPHAFADVYIQDIDHKKPFVLDSWDNWINNTYWGPDRTGLGLRIGANFKFGIKEQNMIVVTQLIKVDNAK